MGKRGRPPYPDILTPREWEVLAHIRDGLTNEEIAARLGISIDGVKFHVAEILSKLGVSSRREAARWRPERQRGLIAAPLGPLSHLRLASPGAASAGLAGTVVVAALVALAVLGVLVSRSRSDEAASVQAPTPTPGPSLGVAPTPPVTPHPVWGWSTGWQVNENTGWLAGVACPSNVNREGCVGMIEKTEDGGETWEEQYRGPLNIFLMQFTDVRTGWAVGSSLGCDDGRACPAHLLATSDGGATWSDVYQLDHEALQMSLTQEDGWLLTQQEPDCGGIEPCVNLLLRSSDGGLTWTTSTLPLGGYSLSLSRPTRDDAWISRGSEVAVTHDGGETWTFLPPPELAYQVGGISDVFFLPSGRGWLLVGDGVGAGSQPKQLFGTDDGGVTWRSVSGTLELSDFSSGSRPENELSWTGYVGELYFALADVGWLTLGRGGLLHTKDGGATWDPLFYDDSQGALSFSDPTHGWVVLHNEPRQTLDGETWTPIKTPPPLP